MKVCLGVNYVIRFSLKFVRQENKKAGCFDPDLRIAKES